MSSWRSARRNGGRPDKRPTVAPVASSAIPTRTEATTSAVVPCKPKRYGRTGTRAPEAKMHKLESAAQCRCRPPRERRSLSPRQSRRGGVRSPRRDQVGVAELVGHLVRGDGGDVMLRAVIVQRKPERYAPQ